MRQPVLLYRSRARGLVFGEAARTMWPSRSRHAAPMMDCRPPVIAEDRTGEQPGTASRPPIWSEATVMVVEEL